jgi:hypothetical protein
VLLVMSSSGDHDATAEILVREIMFVDGTVLRLLSTAHTAPH